MGGMNGGEYWYGHKMEKYLHVITGSGIRDREGIKLVT